MVVPGLDPGINPAIHEKTRGSPGQARDDYFGAAATSRDRLWSLLGPMIGPSGRPTEKKHAGIREAPHRAYVAAGNGAGLGCATLGGTRIPMTRQAAEAIVHAAWDAGVRYVDA